MNKINEQSTINIYVKSLINGKEWLWAHIDCLKNLNIKEHGIQFDIPVDDLGSLGKVLVKDPFSWVESNGLDKLYLEIENCIKTRCTYMSAKPIEENLKIEFSIITNDELV